MKTQMTRLILAAMLCIMATIPVGAVPQYDRYPSNGASMVESSKSEDDAFYVKYSSWFTGTGRALTAVGQWILRPFTADGFAACGNIFKSNDLWEVVAHLSVSVLLLVIVPLLVIFIAQYIYRGFVKLLCMVCDKILWLRIDSSSEFFYFVAYLLFSFSFASCVTTAVAGGNGLGDLWVFLLGSSITSICFVLAMVLHFRKKKFAKCSDIETSAEAAKPGKAQADEGMGEADSGEADSNEKAIANEPGAVKGLFGVRILDIMVEFDWSLILIFVFPILVQGPLELRAMVVGFIIMAVALHELGHALVAKAFGNKVLGIVLCAFGGYTEFRSSRMRGDILVSLAGPLTNLLFAGIFGCLDWVTIAKVNLILGCFNLLPIWPLDGSMVLYKILRKFSSRNNARCISGLVGCVTGIGFIAYVITIHCSAYNINWFSLVFSTLVGLWLTFSSFCLLGTLKVPAEDKKDEPGTEAKIGE